MNRTHAYDVNVTWTGNQETGTSNYRAFCRDHTVTASGRPDILGSSDPAFRGDPERWNPELLLVAALSQCHMLWYLHLAAEAGVTVVAYDDHPHGTMTESGDGAGQFTQVVLRPVVTITHDSDPETAAALHARVPEYCFIARSVNFPVNHEPTIRVA